MADLTLDDVYDDPDNILAGEEDDDDVDGAAELPDDAPDGLSQSIAVPEKHTTDMEDRDDIQELEEIDPEDTDLGDVHPMDEEDGTER